MENLNPLISVIVPVYKVEKYINKCIDSIINQSYKELEIILVDDGSPDNCGKICDEYHLKDSRVNVIHKENGGLSDARNVGIENSHGKYISFIDSDDYVDENYIEKLYRIIKEEDSDMAICMHRKWYGEKCVDKSCHKDFKSSPKEILEKILYSDGLDFLSAWGKLYKINLFDTIRFPKGRLYEDVATTYKLVDLSKEIAVTYEALYNYIIRDSSISHKEFSKDRFDLITSTKEMTDYILDKYPDLKDACNRRLMYAYLSTLTLYVESKVKDKDVEKELIGYIKKNKKSVLKDPKVPKRDRIGIYSLSFGIGFYRFAWNLYSKITGRD